MRVHVRQVQAVDFDVLGAVRCAQELYGRHGMYFKIASIEALHMSAPARTYFETLETRCVDGAANTKRSSLYAQFGVQDLASITAFLIKELRFVRRVHHCHSEAQSFAGGGHAQESFFPAMLGRPVKTIARRTAIAALCVWLAVACGSEQQASTAPQTSPKTVDEHQARTLALKHYRSLSRGLYLRHPRTGELMPFPELDEQYFQYVEGRGDAWLVRAEPLAGWIVIMRVDKNGDWIELLRWGFAPA